MGPPIGNSSLIKRLYEVQQLSGNGYVITLSQRYVNMLRHFAKWPNVALILRIILIFPLGQNHRHRPHSCHCRQQLELVKMFISVCRRLFRHYFGLNLIYLIGFWMTAIWSIRPFYANPKFGNNLVILRESRKNLKVTEKTSLCVCQHYYTLNSHLSILVSITCTGKTLCLK